MFSSKMYIALEHLHSRVTTLFKEQAQSFVAWSHKFLLYKFELERSVLIS